MSSRTLFVALCFFVATSLHAQTPDTVHFHATIDNVKPTFGPAEPVARLKPGNLLEANSLDCFGNALQKPGDLSPT